MIRFLLDTDTASYIAKQRNPSILARFQKLDFAEWAISAITCAEIRYGLETPPSNPTTILRMNEFLFTANALDWPINAAYAYADIKHRTRKQPLAEQDMLIAAHAIALDATLVTNNVRHFSRMGGGLRFENWLEDSHPSA